MTDRFPVAPLLERMAAASIAEAARRLNVNREAVYRVRRTGLLEHDADQWALRAGYHPAELWPDTW